MGQAGASTRAVEVIHTSISTLPDPRRSGYGRFCGDRGSPSPPSQTQGGFGELRHDHHCPGLRQRLRTLRRRTRCGHARASWATRHGCTALSGRCKRITGRTPRKSSSATTPAPGPVPSTTTSHTAGHWSRCPPMITIRRVDVTIGSWTNSATGWPRKVSAGASSIPRICGSSATPQCSASPQQPAAACVWFVSAAERVAVPHRLSRHRPSDVHADRAYGDGTAVSRPTPGRVRLPHGGRCALSPDPDHSLTPPTFRPTRAFHIHDPTRVPGTSIDVVTSVVFHTEAHDSLP